MNEKDRERWDGNYEKRFYLLTVHETGEQVVCWPNAGLMLEDDGRRIWTREDDVSVEPISDEEMEKLRTEGKERWDRAWHPPKDEILVVEGRMDSSAAAEAAARHRRSSFARTLVAHTAVLTGLGFPREKRLEDCTHRFGIAGGFGECPACGIKRKHHAR